MRMKASAVLLAATFALGVGHAADDPGSAAPAARQPGQFRMPVIKTPAQIEALTTLSPEEKAYALDNLKKVPHTDGWLVLGNDPDVQAFWQVMERENTALLYPDMQAIPFSPMNLINLVIGHRGGNEYLDAIMATVTADAIQAFKKDDSYNAKLAMLDRPESDLWTEEERLTILFTVAVLDNKMTDELFNEARATWGDKKLLRHLSWISFVNGWSMLLNVMDARYDPKTMALPKGALNPQSIDKITNDLKGTKEEMRKFWATLSEFKPH